MTSLFLELNTVEDLAQFFGMSYSSLSLLIYDRHIYQYKSFELTKKSGGTRTIRAPSRALKSIQRQLKVELEKIYVPKPSAHGFISDRSIHSNASAHLDRKFIFNIDLEDFFGSIHFGRIRNLLQSSPFNFEYNIATVLAQICCFNQKLPQGAPTSPVISNMIARKMDTALQLLARESRCRYSRYADDITFSFACGRARVPTSIVNYQANGEPTPGERLIAIIEENGFQVNPKKTRLNSQLSRMEVTGLTVNQFPNVRRKYVRQISSMLHAWSKYGYDLAEKKYNQDFNKKQRVTKGPTSFVHVVRGKLLFLRQVRGIRDPIYTKLANRFNALITNETHALETVIVTEPEIKAVNSLWVIQAFDSEGLIEAQGTGFMLEGFGLVTCAHVIGDISNKKTFHKITALKENHPSTEYALSIKNVCWRRDFAICKFDNQPADELAGSVKLSSVTPAVKDELIIMGYPSYSLGHQSSIYDCKVSKHLVISYADWFEVDKPLQGGNSGGPVFNNNFEVVGIVAKREHKFGGLNLCVSAIELEKT